MLFSHKERERGEVTGRYPPPLSHRCYIYVCLSLFLDSLDHPWRVCVPLRPSRHISHETTPPTPARPRTNLNPARHTGVVLRCGVCVCVAQVNCALLYICAFSSFTYTPHTHTHTAAICTWLYPPTNCTYIPRWWYIWLEGWALITSSCRCSLILGGGLFNKSKCGVIYIRKEYLGTIVLNFRYWPTREKDVER